VAQDDAVADLGLLEYLVAQRSPVLFQTDEANVVIVEAGSEAMFSLRRLKHCHRCVDDLGADAITR
jgi:hypothetical protein